MDVSLYKTTKTTRGFTYNYFVKPAQLSKATLLFLHGFPSSSYDWHYQVAHFSKEGYGLIVPDLLGYGGTDKPTDQEKYKGKDIAQDLVDILDAEGIQKAVVIGHDWGCYSTSRLWQYHPDRISALAVLAVAYITPNGFDIATLNALTKQTLGYETFGYQLFFSSKGADQIIESHLDSFLTMLYPGDPDLWKTDMAPIGKLEEWITNDRKSERPSYMSAEEYEKHKAPLAKYGFSANLNWYKNAVHEVSKADDEQIPEERLKVTVPTFFGAALYDYICLASWGKDAIAKNCTNATVKDYETDHWVQLAAPEKLNKELGEWLVASGL